jgi:hypothetical protein
MRWQGTSNMHGTRLSRASLKRTSHALASIGYESTDWFVVEGLSSASPTEMGRTRDCRLSYRIRQYLLAVSRRRAFFTLSPPPQPAPEPHWH